MGWYKNQNVMIKIIIPIIVGFIVLLGAFKFFILPSIEETFMEEKRNYLRAVVDANYSLIVGIENEYKEGKISKEEALKKVENIIRTVRFEGTNYLFIFGSEKMLFHGVNPKLEGQNIDVFKDVNGKVFLVEAAKELKNKNEVFFDYYWKKPDVEGAFPKLSYVRKTPVFNHLLAAGIYIDEVQEIVTRTQNTILIQTLIIVLLLLISLWLVINFSIKKPLKQLIQASESVSNGNLEVDLSYVSRDEIGNVFQSIRGMTENLNYLINETNKLTQSASEGNLDVRGDTSKFKGAYADLIGGVNNTLDAIIRPLNIAAEYIDRISKGDIPPKVTENLKGDFNEIKNNINQCIDAINLLILDTNSLINLIMEGKINERADLTKHNGDFRRIVEGINQLLNRLVGLIDNMPLPVQIVDKNQNVLYSNKTFRELSSH